MVETDAVVVGSGAGGGVVAGALTQAGLGVVVLEKGPYVHPTNIAENDAVATRMAYESQQHLITHDTGAPRAICLHCCARAALLAAPCFRGPWQ